MAEQVQMSQLALLFRNAHAIAKARRPFTDMEWMCDLDEKKGLDVGMSYRTDKKCCEFIQCIAESSRPVYREVISLETSFLLWWMVLLTHLLLRQKLSTSGILVLYLILLGWLKYLL